MQQGSHPAQLHATTAVAALVHFTTFMRRQQNALSATKRPSLSRPFAARPSCRSRASSTAFADPSQAGGVVDGRQQLNISAIARASKPRSVLRPFASSCSVVTSTPPRPSGGRGGGLDTSRQARLVRFSTLGRFNGYPFFSLALSFWLSVSFCRSVYLCPPNLVRAICGKS